MIHAIVGELVSRSLKKFAVNGIVGLLTAKLTHVDDCVTVDEPHDPWARMSGYADTEACPLAFLDGDGFGKTHKHRCFLGLKCFVLLFGNTVIGGVLCQDNRNYPVKAISTYTCHEASISRIRSILFMPLGSCDS